MEQLESMVELIQYIVPSLLVDVGSAFLVFYPIQYFCHYDATCVATCVSCISN